MRCKHGRWYNCHFPHIHYLIKSNRSSNLSLATSYWGVSSWNTPFEILNILVTCDFDFIASISGSASIYEGHNTTNAIINYSSSINKIFISTKIGHLHCSNQRQTTNTFHDIVENLWQISSHIPIPMTTIIREFPSLIWLNLKLFFDLTISINHIIIYSIKFSSRRFLPYLILKVFQCHIFESFIVIIHKVAGIITIILIWLGSFPWHSILNFCMSIWNYTQSSMTTYDMSMKQI
jgi:hypothetical protein